MRIDLSIMNTSNAAVNKISFLNSIAFTNLAYIANLHYIGYIFPFKVKKLVPIKFILLSARLNLFFQIIGTFGEGIQYPHNLFLYRERGERNRYNLYLIGHKLWIAHSLINISFCRYRQPIVKKSYIQKRITNAYQTAYVGNAKFPFTMKYCACIGTIRCPCKEIAFAVIGIYFSKFTIVGSL